MNDNYSSSSDDDDERGVRKIVKDPFQQPAVYKGVHAYNSDDDEDHEKGTLKRPLLLSVDKKSDAAEESNKMGGSGAGEAMPVAGDKGICEKLFPALAEGTKLNKAEVEFFHKFKRDYVQPYDDQNANHEVELHS